MGMKYELADQHHWMKTISTSSNTEKKQEDANSNSNDEDERSYAQKFLVNSPKRKELFSERSETGFHALLKRHPSPES